ncbi:hypothetical protein Misp01_44590 [Microtetraspora sp. NBRC 13810]|uniref:universal stress protein n=1 Tax=Microtetraspora sp. NBRC 13810 TaxID=3030990 RepID=UPI0024A3CC24|nr:universal stress protein [Microtetraspora sp. NBRC 13810]GLW09330.1 hypothetical protein Misp01_44590 [Microtetraspora sp. NBRC 13810]
MIVVGVDGSRAGLEAVAWAAGEAALRRRALHIVHALPGWAHEKPASGPYAEVARWMRECAVSVLTEALDRARADHPDLPVTTVMLPGDPRPVLVDAAAGAELLVVGDHGLGGFRGLLLGSVALGVAGRTPCPAVVVGGVSCPPRDEVVVGVDGSAASAAAVGFAFAEAEARKADLRAVHAWNSLAPGAGVDPFPAVQQDGAERRLLTEALAPWRERHPGVNVIEQADRGHPVDVLRKASAGADLLVVGSRGRGEVPGLVLGSVGHALLHHTECPIAVVP